jgi:hypothetical protein
MKDKNGKIIKEGMEVDVPVPNESDMHNFEFRGYVDGFRNGNVLVLDGDMNYFEIEPERLEVVED